MIVRFWLAWFSVYIMGCYYVLNTSILGRLSLVAFFVIWLTGMSTAQKLSSDNKEIEKAFNLALTVVDGNVHDGILAAGGDYGGEWTRDIAINSWNGVSFLRPQVAEKSLWSVTLNKDSIGHQYWDKIIWVIAALNHYNVNGNGDFLRQAYFCSKNTMKQLEETQFDMEYGLFMGPSVFNDGIAGYPSPIFDSTNLSTFVLDHKNSRTIKCLSTNALYYQAYKSLAQMSNLLKLNEEDVYLKKAEILKKRIIKNFYRTKEKTFSYLIDHTGSVDQSQEGLGVSFSVIFKVITGARAKALVENSYTSKFGIPSIYPDFPRYSADTPGRHNNIIWPMVNGFFAKAAKLTRNYGQFEKELTSLTHLAIDPDKGNNDFKEIYNPYTGSAFGGWQSNKLTRSCNRQTWSATAYIDMILNGVVGLRFRPNGGIAFEPYLPKDISVLNIEGLNFRGQILNISLEGQGSRIKEFYFNGNKIATNNVRGLLAINNNIRIILTR